MTQVGSLTACWKINPCLTLFAPINIQDRLFKSLIKAGRSTTMSLCAIKVVKCPAGVHLGHNVTISLLISVCPCRLRSPSCNYPPLSCSGPGTINNYSSVAGASSSSTVLAVSTAACCWGGFESGGGKFYLSQDLTVWDGERNTCLRLV